MTSDESSEPKAASRETIRIELDRLEAGGQNSGRFLILAKADEDYMQVAPAEGGFVLEIREGDEASHMVAAPINTFQGYVAAKPRSFFSKLIKGGQTSDSPIPRATCEAALVAFNEGRQFKSGFDWRKLFI